jgi:large subunit ribosomal protein L24
VKVKIRKGDTVEIISGRLEDKGKRGQVIRVLPEERRVVVQGATSARNTSGKCRLKVYLNPALLSSKDQFRLE